MTTDIVVAGWVVKLGDHAAVSVKEAKAGHEPRAIPVDADGDRSSRVTIRQGAGRYSCRAHRSEISKRYCRTDSR